MAASFGLLLVVCLILSLLSRPAGATIYENDTLLSALHRNAGVFRNGSRPGLERTVLLTGCNHGFLNHLENFRCFAERLNMKFLVIALDNKAFEYIRRNTTMDAIFMSTAGVTGDAVEFRSKQFNLITARKKEAVHDVLDLGFDVLFTDTDVALLRDPFPYMLYEHVDYVHSLNAICTQTNTWDFRRSREEGNTGFYYVKSSNRTIALWRDAFEAVPRFPGLDDQAVFWRVIRQGRNPPVMPIGNCRNVNWTAESAAAPQVAGVAKGTIYTAQTQPLVTCVLDPCVFSSGMLSRAWIPEYTYEELMVNLASRNETIVSLHANYIKGNKGKMQRMEEYGFWLATKSTHTAHDIDGSYWGGACAPYVPYAFNFTSAPSAEPVVKPSASAPNVSSAHAPSPPGASSTPIAPATANANTTSTSGGVKLRARRRLSPQPEAEDRKRPRPPVGAASASSQSHSQSHSHSQSLSHERMRPGGTQRIHKYEWYE